MSEQNKDDIFLDEENEIFDDDYIKERIIRENKIDRNVQKLIHKKASIKNKMISKGMIRSLPFLAGFFFVSGLFSNSYWSISHYKDYRNSTGLALIQKAEQSAPAPLTDEQMMTLVQKIKSRSTIPTYIQFLKE